MGEMRTAITRPATVHCDHTPMARPIFCKGNRRGTMLGPQAASIPIPVPSMTRAARKPAASGVNKLATEPMMVMTIANASVNLTPMFLMIQTAGKQTMQPMNSASPEMLPIMSMPMPWASPTNVRMGFHFMTTNTTANPVIIIETSDIQRWLCGSWSSDTPQARIPVGLSI